MPLVVHTLAHVAVELIHQFHCLVDVDVGNIGYFGEQHGIVIFQSSDKKAIDVGDGLEAQ